MVDQFAMRKSSLNNQAYLDQSCTKTPSTLSHYVNAIYKRPLKKFRINNFIEATFNLNNYAAG